MWNTQHEKDIVYISALFLQSSKTATEGSHRKLSPLKQYETRKQLIPCRFLKSDTSNALQHLVHVESDCTVAAGCVSERGTSSTRSCLVLKTHHHHLHCNSHFARQPVLGQLPLVFFHQLFQKKTNADKWHARVVIGHTFFLSLN